MIEFAPREQAVEQALPHAIGRTARIRFAEPAGSEAIAEPARDSGEQHDERKRQLEQEDAGEGSDGNPHHGAGLERPSADP